MTVCQTITEDRMKLLFFPPCSLLLIILTETNSVFDIIANSKPETNHEKPPERRDMSSVLNNALEDDIVVTYQELRNIVLAHKTNQMKRNKLKRKFLHELKNRRKDIFRHFSFLTKLG